MTISTIDDRAIVRAEQAARELQRVEHLVLGRSRPLRDEQAVAKPRKGRKGRRVAARISRPIVPVMLASGIEEFVALRERWSHKQGTPETHEHLERYRNRPGSLARLYESGTIDKDQLAAADQIAEAYRAITADVSIRTASLETRVDVSAHGRAEHLQLGLVHCDLAYTFWRAAVGGAIDIVLAVIIHDTGLTIAARERRISMPVARRILIGALDLWPQSRRATRGEAVAIAG